MNLSKITDRLKYLRKLTRLNRTELANKNHVPEITLRAWETGKIPLTHKGAERCVKLFYNEGITVSIEWILHGIGSMPTGISSNFFAPYTIYDKSLLLTGNETDNLIAEANFLKEVCPHLYIHFIETEEMLLTYKIGDFVGGILYYQDFEQHHNKDCIIILESEKTLFRTLIVASDEKYNLICRNPLNSIDSIIFNAKIKAIAPIKLHRIK